MKLRNKRTGDVWDFDGGFSMNASHKTAERAGARSGSLTCYADSLAELNDEWEDYEDPKDRWYINEENEPQRVGFGDPIEDIENLEEIGLLFKTKKEAERAVDKLKAWKRLKDKGFKFEGIKEDYTRILQEQKPFRTGKRYLQFNKSEDEDWMKENWNDLSLLFSEEEE